MGYCSPSSTTRYMEVLRASQVAHSQQGRHRILPHSFILPLSSPTSYTVAVFYYPRLLGSFASRSPSPFTQGQSYLLATSLLPLLSFNSINYSMSCNHHWFGVFTRCQTLQQAQSPSLPQAPTQITEVHLVHHEGPSKPCAGGDRKEE